MNENRSSPLSPRYKNQVSSSLNRSLSWKKALERSTEREGAENSMASEKRCLYEILGLTNRECSPEEIRSAYRKLALQRHPDKLIQTGVPEEQATAAFQELVNAYEVLSDTRERAWYDSHRSQILFSDIKSSGASSVPDLFSFFSNSVFSGFGDTGKGFFKVYGDLFGKIYAQEVSFAKKLGLGIDAVRDSPLMGNLESPYTQVSAFYGYWLGFCTVMDFCWVDEYDAMAGPNRKSRRLMEDENKKLRKKAKRDYNDTVRGLAEFVKKRDKRVIEMQMKKNLEQEKKKEEEIARKKEAERVKMERAMLYEEPEWAKIEEEEIEDVVDDEVQDDNKKNELYCVVCSKKFKSDKQWKNHEQSKKHKEKVAELKYSIQEEEKLFGKKEKVESVDDFSEQFEESLDLKDEQSEEVKNSLSDEEGTAVSVGDLDGSDEETSVLKAMVSGRKNKKNAARKREPTLSSSKSHVSPDEEEIDLMEYDSRRNSRRNRAAKKERGKKSNGDSGTAEISEITEEVPNRNNRSEEVTSNSNGHNVRDEEDEGHENVHLEDPVSHKFDESEPNNGEDPPLDSISKVQKKPVVDKRGAGKADTNTKLKNTSKGKKQKGASKNTDHLCDTCGEDFDSRNKLHKHLGDTGHASLKSR